MARVEGMEILAARLASFDVAHPAPKRRTSHAKSSKSFMWPHQSPSPGELANAGFFYKPSNSSPDNTICFLCDKALDGWEEDDDPVQEHLKHSPNCGWAIMTSMERLSGEERVAEDPTSSRMVEARRATFVSRWPHEGKRGWSCKVEKMVRAGWYYCPTHESDDFVSCAYCNLCLDGWEPKDDPFDEHMSRSPDCRFFHFTSKTTTKRGRKTRTSKSSRISTQSNMTTTSEAPVLSLEMSIDQGRPSDVSVMNSTVSGSKTTKKGSKVRTSTASTRARGARGKKYNPVEIDSSLVEVDMLDQSQPQTRSKKRNSDQISDDDQDNDGRGSTAKVQPSLKRRATKDKLAQSQNDSAVFDTATQIDDGAITEVEGVRKGKKGPKGNKGRKGGPSNPRKVSATSKPQRPAQIPANDDIEAALEAELERPLTDEEQEMTKSNQKKFAGSRASSSTASKEGTRKDTSGGRQQDQPEGDPTHLDSEMMPSQRIRDSGMSAPLSTSQPSADLDSSLVTTRTMEDDSGHETDASVAGKSVVRKGGKRKAGGIRKGQAKKGPKNSANKPSFSDRSSDYSRTKAKDTVVDDGNNAGSDNNAFMAPNASMANKVTDKPISRPTYVQPMAATSPPKQTTPSPSPQLSDAENQPPSSRPTSSRPPVFSPSRPQTVKVPLAPSTPTMSPSRLNPSKALQSRLPWTAVDLDNVFSVLNGNQENEANARSNPILASPEKKMTVEEWVLWKAQKGEEMLRQECERLVGIFEREGGKAMRTLEGIECPD